MNSATQKFPWTKELEKTVISSLTTSFGLDFLLFEDKRGGEVDTVNNVRKNIWATDSEKERYAQNENYESTPYHQHKNYIATGKEDKKNQASGTLKDSYRNTVMGAHEKRNLDHVISANEIHNDQGRVLAELSGVDLANQNSNLQTTHESINKSKGKTPINEYLTELPNLISRNEKSLERDKARLERMPRDTPQQQHEARALEDSVRQTENKINELKAIDPESMRKRDTEARKHYDQQINKAYYTSSKFISQTAHAAGSAGLSMGTRQMLGLVMAEIWFELREQLPSLLNKLKNHFSLETFVDSIKSSLQGIWKRVQERFKDFLTAFKDGVFAGILGSLTTTVFNIFATTQSMAIKLIRETWGHMVKAIKLMIFNPDQLNLPEQCQAVTALLSIGVATVIGTMAHTYLLPFLSFPFGSELAAFAGALITGLVTLGLNYFLLHSEMANKLWEFVASLKIEVSESRKTQAIIDDFQKINNDLDNYLLELSKVELNMDTEELKSCLQELEECNDEIKRSLILRNTIKSLEIDIPFEVGNLDSTRNWLASRV